jgi:transcriptional regulator with XRE-family HTH domain
MILMARRRAGFTQRELASRLGCQQATIARWERGDRQASFDEVQAAANACGLDLDTHLVVEDHSWWPQIAAQAEREPLERVRHLTPPYAPDYAGALELLARGESGAIVVGAVAGALHGWPLVLSESAVEVCATREDMETGLDRLIVRRAGQRYELRGGHRVDLIEQPPGTAGLRDLARGAETLAVAGHDLRVAGLLDLVRIADASPARGASRLALAYQTVLAVRHARDAARARPPANDQQRLARWLADQTPVM